MADLKPLGSEKLQGMDKINRILEIARYNETPKQEVNELSTLDYTIKLADGNTYGIVKEKSGYIIKKGINESSLDYSEPMRQRKYFRSYSEAMKKLNLVAGELNRIHENDYEIPLIGEQKFVLKTKKKSKPETEQPSDVAPPAAPPADMSATPPAAPPSDMGATPPAAQPADMGATPPPTDMGTTPPMEEPMGGGMEEPMGGEMEEPMGTEEPPMDGGMAEPMGGEDEDEGEGPSALKSIQKLTGKLGQKIRSYDKEKGLDSQDIKYVINSILSAIDLENLDEDDKEDILSKFEETDEYGMEGPGELDLGGEEDLDMGNGMEEPMGGGMEEPMDNQELKVESVLAKYFDIKPSEKRILESKMKKQYLTQKINKINNKKELENMCESYRQLETAKNILEENEDAKFIGKTNKKNLVIVVEGRQIKVTPKGNII